MRLEVGRGSRKGLMPPKGVAGIRARAGVEDGRSRFSGPGESNKKKQQGGGNAGKKGRCCKKGVLSSLQEREKKTRRHGSFKALVKNGTYFGTQGERGLIPLRAARGAFLRYLKIDIDSTRGSLRADPVTWSGNFHRWETGKKTRGPLEPTPRKLQKRGCFLPARGGGLWGTGAGAPLARGEGGFFLRVFSCHFRPGRKGEQFCGTVGESFCAENKTLSGLRAGCWGGFRDGGKDGADIWRRVGGLAQKRGGEQNIFGSGALPPLAELSPPFSAENFS